MINQSEFTIVKAARAIVPDARPISAATRKKYESLSREGRRNVTWAAVRDGGIARQSWYLYRAALVWGISHDLREHLRLRDRAQRAGDMDARERHTRVLASLIDDHERVSAARWVNAADKRPPPNGAGKRRGLSRLPPDWQDEMLKAAPERHRLPVAVLAASGCRPAELQAGVQVVVRDERLFLGIKGAKVTAENGQEHRWLQLDPSSSLSASFLYEHAAQWPDDSCFISPECSQGAFYQAVRRLGLSLFADIKYCVTPYSFRQAFAASAKADGHSRLTVAVAMGHRGSRSQGHYGLPNQARGRGGLLAAHGTNEVRMHDHQPVFATPQANIRPRGPGM